MIKYLIVHPSLLLVFYGRVAVQFENKIDGGRNIVSKEKRKIAFGIILEVNADRVRHFKKRIAELGRTASDTVIVLINVDDVFGNVIAEKLMPGHDWQ